MKITLTGGSGFIGRRLLKMLAGNGHTVHILSRHAGTNLPPGVKLSVWDATKGEPPADALEGADAVVNLAGEPVAQKWSAAARQKIRESRVQGTQRLIQGLSTISQRPSALISASAIGIYGARNSEVVTETSSLGTGFLAEVCQEWEKEAELAESLGMRVVKIRIGIVLDRNGGALAKMLPAFRNFAGGRLASGKQWMSWIHLQDLGNLFKYAVENPVKGVFNGTAPNPVTNAEFTKQLAAVLHRPALFPVPALALKAIFGEMSQVLTTGQRVLPKAAEAAGFQFQYPELGPALTNLLK
jgi:uncharacterized protein (TIGR01777 family)